MTIIKIINCNLNGRSNQNTTFTLITKDHPNTPIEQVTESWIQDNLEELKPPNVKLQNNTSVKIVRQSK
jgi:hypothetical protein